MILYHVSPSTNRHSIETTGIDPCFSRGKLQECWFVHGLGVPWALLHCRKRHGVYSLEALDVWEVEVEDALVTRRRGFLVSSHATVPTYRILRRRSWEDYADDVFDLQADKDGKPDDYAPSDARG